MVPVIKDADKKGLKEISRELTELSKKAREGKVKPNEMQGATFTILEFRRYWWYRLYADC